MSQAPGKQIEKPRIIILSEFVDKGANSTGYYWEYLAKMVSASGFQVRVISTAESWARTSMLPDSIECDEIHFREAQGTLSLYARILYQLKLSTFMLLKLHKISDQKDIVITGTNPALVVPFLAVARAFKGWRWVLVCLDVFPDNLIAAKILKRSSIFYRILQFVFARSYRKASRIVAIGRDMAEVVEQKTKMLSKISYIPTFVDLEGFDYLECPDSSNKKEGETVEFVFFGNLGRVQGLDILVEAIDKVESKKAKFVFIGDGASSDLINALCLRRTNCERLEAIPFSENIKGLRVGDVAIVSLEKGMYGLGVPSKAYFSLAAGKRLLVIGDENSELCRLIRKNESAGWFCESGDSDAIANTIDMICKKSSFSDCKTLRSIVRSDYSFESSQMEYIRLINDIIDKTKNTRCDNKPGASIG